MYTTSESGGVLRLESKHLCTKTVRTGQNQVIEKAHVEQPYALQDGRESTLIIVTPRLKAWGLCFGIHRQKFGKAENPRMRSVSYGAGACSSLPEA